MFGSLTEKLTGVFETLLGKKKLTEENIAEAVREVRLALLEADVHYAIAKNFIKRVKEKILGSALIDSVTPGQQFIQVIHEELVSLMGGQEAALNLQAKPAILMLCGLQGSGKTTQAAKLAKYFCKTHSHKKPLLVACDLQRPAAIEQLKILGAQIQVSVFALEGEKDPRRVAKEALKLAKKEGHDLVILDTAGRLHIDEPLMKELQSIKTETQPHEIFFVANAATGQDAVEAASGFDQALGVTGTILTMLDGDARAGAAISIREATGKPLQFEGMGEELEALQRFNPHSMADRILGMGDTINLVKRAKEHVSEEEVKELEEKMRKASFTYEDYLKQMQSVRKMGSLRGIMKLLPGGAQLPNFDESEKEFQKIEAIILSMTPEERSEHVELSISRSKRIARGSGTRIEDVNKLKKTFKSSKQFLKKPPSQKMLDKLGGHFFS